MDPQIENKKLEARPAESTVPTTVYISEEDRRRIQLDAQRRRGDDLGRSLTRNA